MLAHQEAARLGRAASPGLDGMAVETGEWNLRYPYWVAVQTSDGNALYCRSVFILGSRIPHTECETGAELKSYVCNQIVDDNLVQWTCPEYRP
jgi:hypothetical protein